MCFYKEAEITKYLDKRIPIFAKKNTNEQRTFRTGNSKTRKLTKT